MRMGGHVPGPGVEAPHHAELPAEGVGIESQGVSGSRRGLKKQGVQASLVRAGERSQCLRSRTGNQNGRDRQEQRTLLCSPRGGRGLLARGAMPVRAGMRAVCQCSAGGAWGEMPAKSLGPALGNGRHGLSVTRWYTVVALSAGGRAMAPEAVSQRDHGSPPETRRGFPSRERLSCQSRPRSHDRCAQ